MALHAKLMLPDADGGDLDAALDRAGCTWSAVDLETGTLRDVARPRPDDRVAVLVRRRRAGTPGWKVYLRGLGVDLTGTGDAETESALVVVRTATDPPRTLVWCFGTASQAVPNELVDGRFGLIVALNKHAAGTAIAGWRHLPESVRRRPRRADPRARVRQLASTVRDGHQHTVIAKGVGAAPVEGLRFDSMSDLLRGVTVRTDDDLMPDLEGGRGLKVVTFVDGWSDLAALADHLVVLRGRTDYRQDWDWVDHVVPVAPRGEDARLIGELGRIVADDPAATVDLVLPELDEDVVGTADLSFRIGRQPDWRRPVEWRHVRNRLVQACPGPIAHLHRKVRILPLDGPEETAQEFPLRDLLVAEFQIGGKQYVLGDGELLVVDADYLRRLDAAVAAVRWSDFPFPSYQGTTESEYLRAAAERSRNRLVMLDEEPVRLPGESPFEACDLFADDGRLVFGKLKGRSSMFSHLCTQAEVAAEMFLQHAAARDALLARLDRLSITDAAADAALTVVDALERRRADAVTVTLLLLGPWRKRDLTTLPLVSRVRLRRAAARIRALGYRFEVAAPATDSVRGRRYGAGSSRRGRR